VAVEKGGENVEKGRLPDEMIALHCQSAESDGAGLDSKGCELQELLKIDGEIGICHGCGMRSRLLATEAQIVWDCEDDDREEEGREIGGEDSKSQLSRRSDRYWILARQGERSGVGCCCVLTTKGEQKKKVRRVLDGRYVESSQIPPPFPWHAQVRANSELDCSSHLGSMFWRHSQPKLRSTERRSCHRPKNFGV
jgi:hypothetical protein